MFRALGVASLVFAVAYVMLRSRVWPITGRGWVRQQLQLHRRQRPHRDLLASALKPLVKRLAPYLSELQEEQLLALDRKLAIAGWPFGMRSALLFHVARIVAPVLMALLAWPRFWATPSLITGFPAFVLPPALVMLPSILLNSRLESRERAVLAEFPGLLDLLRINLHSARLTLPAALRTAEQTLRGPLREEVRRLNVLLTVESDLRHAFAVFYDRLGVLAVEVALDSLLQQHLTGTSSQDMADLLERQAYLSREMTRTATLSAVRRRAMLSSLLPIPLGFVVLVLQGYPLVMKFISTLQFH